MLKVGGYSDQKGREGMHRGAVSYTESAQVRIEAFYRAGSIRVSGRRSVKMTVLPETSSSKGPKMALA